MAYFFLQFGLVLSYCYKKFNQTTYYNYIGFIIVCFALYNSYCFKFLIIKVCDV